MKTKVSASMKTDPGKLPQFLAYALPRAPNDNGSRVKTFDTFILHDEPLGSTVSFLDYDGVVLLAGAFERVQSSSMEPPTMVCASSSDLDLREREFFSCLQYGKPIIFLVSHLAHTIGYSIVSPQCDLFRRFAQNLSLECVHHERAAPSVESIAPEFRDYITRFGTGYVEFGLSEDYKHHFRQLCKTSQSVFGLVFAGKVFLLPSAVTKTEGQLDQIIVAAITAVLAYRKRMSSQMPAWVNDFVFTHEDALRTKLEEHQKQALDLEGKIGRYEDFKGALCYQSQPLVNVISDLMQYFLGIDLSLGDKYIEDATLRDDQDKILAVFEIKGVKGNFSRNNVNQVDSHRERLGVAPDTPGVLIMNTFMDADSLKEKDQPPNPDIIKKAAADRVLLMRTLDLLRYANAVEGGAVTKQEFMNTILSESGWLRLDNSKVTVIRS